MSSIVIALLVSISAGVWVYNKFHRRTGGNSQTSSVAAIIVGVLVLIVVYSLLGFLPKE